METPSMEGWSFAKFWAKNKVWFVRVFKDPSVERSIKALVSAIMAVLAGMYPQNAIWVVLFGAGGAYATQLVLTMLEYAFKSNPK